jgi:hypothetical protein
MSRFADSQHSVEQLGNIRFAGAAAFGPERALAAEGAVVALSSKRAHSSSLFVAHSATFRAPDRNRPLHHPASGGQTEIFNHRAGPPVALVAGVKALAADAVADFAHGTVKIELLGRITLHAAPARRLFGLCLVEIAHGFPEFFVFIPGGDVHAAGAAVKPQGAISFLS